MTDAERLAAALQHIRFLVETKDSEVVEAARKFLAKIEPDPRKVLDDHFAARWDGPIDFDSVRRAYAAITAQLDAQDKKIAEIEASATPQSQAHVAAVENAAERRGRIAEVKYWLDKGLNRFAMSDEFRRRLAELGRT